MVLTTLSFHMKKRHSTVLQNAWSKKTNTLIEKSIITESTYIENRIKNFTIFTAFQELRKNNSGLENPVNSNFK